MEYPVEGVDEKEELVVLVVQEVVDGEEVVVVAEEEKVVVGVEEEEERVVEEAEMLEKEEAVEKVESGRGLSLSRDKMVGLGEGEVEVGDGTTGGRGGLGRVRRENS